MGGVADFVGDAFSEVGHAVESVGKIAEDTVREIGHAAESVGREIGKIGEAAAQNPIGTIAKVAAVASGQWWALPLVSAVDVVAHGGDLGQAALAAGVSVAAAWAGGAIASELAAPAADSVASMATQDAANMVSQNIPVDQISQTLQQSYGISGNIADSIANASTAGISANTLASSYAGAFGQGLTGAADAFSERLAATAIGNSAANFGVKLVQTGGDVNKALLAGAGAGIGTEFGGIVSNELSNAGVNDAISTAAGKVVGGTTSGVVQGQDINKALGANLVNNIVSTSFAQAGSQLKTAWNSVNETATKYNDTAQAAQDLLKNEVEPARTAAQTAQETAAASYKEYKTQSDAFADLVKQYDDAKAAGNTSLANELADKANAMIPTLNSATDKYNTDAETYQSALDKFNTSNAKLDSTGKQLDELKTTYQQQNETLTKQTEDLSTAAAKVAELNNPNAVKLFNDTYGTGADATTALNNATDYSKLSTTAQGAFDRNYTTNKDMGSAFDFANKVNSLDAKQQSAYAVALNNGLDDTKALEVAPTISSFNTNQQSAYTSAIKQGYGAEAADFMAALSSFKEEPTTQYAPTASTTTSDQPAPLVPSDTKGLTPTEAAFTSPYLLDAQGNLVKDSSGNPVPNPLAQGSTADKGITSTTTAPDANTSGAPVLVGSKPNPDGTTTETYSDGTTKVFNPNTGEYEGKATPVQDQTIPNANDVSGTPTISAPATKTGGVSTVTGPSTAGPTPPEQTGNYITRYDSNGKPYQVFEATDANGIPIPITPLPSPTIGGAGGTPSTGTGSSPSPGTGTGGTGTDGTGTGGTGTGTGGTGTGGAGVGAGVGGALLGAGGYGTWLSQQGQDQYGGIKNLTPGLTQRMDYTLTGMPVIQEAANPTGEVPKFATGGSSTYDPFATGSSTSSGLDKALTPGLTKAQIQYILSGLPGSNISVQGHAAGGEIEGHNPTFFSEGGLESIDNRYVQGEGDGTSDSVAAMLANGEFVIPADVVSKLGNGSNEAGAGVLDQFLKVVRKDANSNGTELPPKSKGPLAYLLDAKRKVKA